MFRVCSQIQFVHIDRTAFILNCCYATSRSRSLLVVNRLGQLHIGDRSIKPSTEEFGSVEPFNRHYVRSLFLPRQRTFNPKVAGSIPARPMHECLPVDSQLRSHESASSTHWRVSAETSAASITLCTRKPSVKSGDADRPSTTAPMNSPTIRSAQAHATSSQHSLAST